VNWFTQLVKIKRRMRAFAWRSSGMTIAKPSWQSGREISAHDGFDTHICPHKEIQKKCPEMARARRLSCTAIRCRTGFGTCRGCDARQSGQDEVGPAGRCSWNESAPHATMEVVRGNRQSQSRTGVEAIIDRRLRMLIHSIMSVSLKWVWRAGSSPR
jgi:hypothetical protein